MNTTGYVPRLRLAGLQVYTEVIAARRNVEFVIGLVAIPAILYAMFGMPNDNTLAPGGATFGTLAVGSFGAYGVVSLAIFAFGDEVAKERGRGWIRTLRATPIPVSTYLVGKLAMAAVYAALIVFALAVLAVPTSAAELSVEQWLGVAGVLVAGVLAFSTVGLSIAFLVRPRAASAIANLIFLPLAFTSGFFFPLSELPGLLRELAPFLPSYHLGQLVWQVVGTDADVVALTGIDPEPIGVHIAWVVGCMLVFGLIAALAARRESVSRR